MGRAEREYRKYTIEFRVVDSDGIDWVSNVVDDDQLAGLRQQARAYKREHSEGVVINVLEHNKLVNGLVMDLWCIEHIEV